jgi:hypothetical protein
MGNCSFSSFPEETLQDEFNIFVKECCYCSDNSYCNYWEFATIFSIFLQSHEHSNYFVLLEWLKKYRGKTNLSKDDWDSLSYRFIHCLCEKGLLKRYGSPNEFPLILGIKIERLRTQHQYIAI